jgi:uncharacterized protein (TIGR00369 family)
MDALVRTRTISWSPPLLDATEVRAMSGLEYLRHALEQGLRPPPICALLDFRSVRFEHGLAVLEAMPAEFHYNMLGTVHGGFAATLLDSALGGAVHSTLPPGFGYATVDLQVKFVRPMTAETGLVTCEGRVINVGARIGMADARLTDAKGKLYAHGTATCMILPLAAASGG